MTKLRGWSGGFGVVLILCGLGVSGCGGRAFPPRERGGGAVLESAATPSPAPVPSLVPAPVAEEMSPAKLGIRLEIEGVPQVTLENGERFEVTGKQLRYAGVIFLPSPQKGGAWSSFSWPENPWGSPIRDAHFDYEVWDALGRRIEFREHLTASFDRTARRWFIPLSRLFQGRESEADASAEQRLLLDLLLADGKRVELLILFRAVGPLPSLTQRLIRPAQEQLRASADWGEELRNSGKPLLIHEIANPYPRDLALWVRSPGGSLTYRAQLAAALWEGHGNRPPTPVQRSFWTEGKVEVAELSLEQSSQSDRRIPISALSQWTRVPLPPGASVRLSWIGKAPTPQPFCRVPPQAPLRIEWTRRVTHRSGRPSEFDSWDEDIREGTTVMETWQLTGIQLSGRMQADVWLADPFLSLQDIAKAVSGTDPVVAGRVQALMESASQELQAKAGLDPLAMSPPVGQPFACQGIFH